MPKKKLHKKPTTEELQEEMDKAVAELDKEETPEETPEEEGDIDANVEPEEEAPEEDVKETEDKQDKPKEDVKEEAPKHDYEKRYKDSTREAQVLASKNKKMADAISKAGSVKDATDEEMEEEFPEWDMMSDTEKRLAKDNLTNKRKMDAIGEVTIDFKDMDAWNTKVDDFITDPSVLIDNPELEGKEEDFKIFVTKPTRRGVDMKDLVSAFLHEDGKKVVVKNTGKMFETGTGGESKQADPDDGKLSVEESISLKDEDYEKYKRYLKEGKIKTTVI